MLFTRTWWIRVCASHDFSHFDIRLEDHNDNFGRPNTSMLRSGRFTKAR